MNEETQNAVNEMLCATLDPTAQEHVIEIYQNVSVLPNFCMYLFSSISNEELSFSVRAEAAHALRRYFSQADDQSKQSIAEAAESVFYQCLLSDDKVFVRSISALISGLIAALDESPFPNISDHINALLSNEETLFAGIDLLHELSLINYFIEGDYIAHIPELIYSNNIDLAVESINLTLQMSKEKKGIVKEAIIIPVLTQGNVMQNLSDRVVVVIISIVENLLEEGDEYTASGKKYLYLMNS